MRLLITNPEECLFTTIARLLLGREKSDKIWPRIVKLFDNHCTLGFLPDGNFIIFRQFTADHFIIMEIYYSRVYDQLFKPEKDDIIVDVGAHIGVYTLKAAKLVGKKGKVFAFEPESQNFNLLLKNIALNRAKNVVPLNLGLSNFEGKARLYLDPQNVGGHSLKYDETKNWCEIRVSTLDLILARLNIKSVDLMKIDVEGQERAVLEGCSKLLGQKRIKKIVVAAYHYPTEEKEIKQFLSKCDFNIYTANVQSYGMEHKYVYARH